MGSEAGRAARGVHFAVAGIGAAVGIAGHIAERVVAAGIAQRRGLGGKRAAELRRSRRVTGGIAA